MQTHRLIVLALAATMTLAGLRAEDGSCGGGDAGGSCGGNDIGGGGGSCGAGAECAAYGFDTGASNPFGLSDEEVGAIAEAYGRAAQVGALNGGLSEAAAAALGQMTAAAIANGLANGLPAGFVTGEDKAAIGAAARGMAAAEGVDVDALGRALGATIAAVDAIG